MKPSSFILPIFSNIVGQSFVNRSFAIIRLSKLEKSQFYETEIFGGELIQDS